MRRWSAMAERLGRRPRRLRARAKGKVVFISPMLDKETGPLRVMAEIDNRDGIWRPGTFVDGGDRSGRAHGPARGAGRRHPDHGRPDRSHSFAPRTDSRSARSCSADGTSGPYEVVGGARAGETIAVSNTFLLKAEMLKGPGRRLIQVAAQEKMMINRLLPFRSAHWPVVLLTLFVAAYGCYELTRLPIDAVPDITNKQVMINYAAPALSPAEIEKRITFPIETAISAPPASKPRGRCRATVTAKSRPSSGRPPTFTSCASRSPSGWRRSQPSLPPGIEPQFGPTSTGLGEVFMYSDEYTSRATRPHRRPAGLAERRSFLTHEGERLSDPVER